MKRARELPISHDQAIAYVVAEIGRDRWFAMHLGVQEKMWGDALCRIGNDQAAAIAVALKAMAVPMRTIRGASSSPRAGVTAAFSDPLTFEDLDELGRQLGIMVTAYDEARKRAALAIEANRRLGDRPRGGELRPLRRKGGKYHLRAVRQREFLRRCLEADPELRLRPQPAFWMHLAIAMQIDPPLKAGGAAREARRNDWGKLLKGFWNQGGSPLTM